MSIRNVFCTLELLAFLGCGGAGTPAHAPAGGATDISDGASGKAAPNKKAVDVDAEAGAIDEKLPSTCASKEPCRPPAGWVDKLCHDVYPGLGVYLFQKNLPWERRYLTRRTEAVNASGGATREGWLEFDEEVLVLKLRKAPAGGMQVSGASESYDALRWDGSCVTLSGEEVTTTTPPSPKSAFVTWRFLDDNLQEALKEDEKIRGVYRERTKECKGQNQGEVSKGCVKADKQLSALIVDWVRRGGKLPTPIKLP
ncbi:MAG TPA: hypothetical protein VIV60_16690 [Polyangiaceae bacterium]